MDHPDNPLSEVGSEQLVKIDTPTQDEKPITKESNRGIEKTIESPIYTDSLNLTEDVFGEYWNKHGEKHTVKRFTWRNRNKIQVQVINYGARITSIRLPDRKGDIEDIVLGFDDIEGYIFYKKYYFGATIGRVTGIVRNSTFQIDKKQYWVNKNQAEHHVNGGKVGLDQALWKTYIDGKKVIMTHVSPHLTEGYPGDLFVRITFALTEVNEFKINMEAFSSEPTIVNLSNLTYFNLGGHNSGSEDINKHIVTLNCNCFTPEVDGLPTGEILNVANTEYDFQIPKVLGKVMEATPKTGYNQNLCINRGMDQGDCFVGRILHPPSGRLLEVYSNQYGVNLSTANEFGYGKPTSALQRKRNDNVRIEADSYAQLYNTVYNKLIDTLKADEQHSYQDLRDLVLNIERLKPGMGTPYNSPVDSVDRARQISLTPLQKDYLEEMLRIISEQCENSYECATIKDNIETILKISVLNVKKIFDSPKSSVGESKQIDTEKSVAKESRILHYNRNKDHIVGKERIVYRMHGAIALRTQNYNCCANFLNFPNCVLYPGQSYKHSITYKFWIRAGSPNKWIRRNLKETRGRNKNL